MGQQLSKQYVATGLDACHARIAELEQTLRDINDRIDGYVDVFDGSDGQPQANVFMELRQLCDRVLAL